MASRTRRKRRQTKRANGQSTPVSAPAPTPAVTASAPVMSTSFSRQRWDGPLDPALAAEVRTVMVTRRTPGRELLMRPELAWLGIPALFAVLLIPYVAQLLATGLAAFLGPDRRLQAKAAGTFCVSLLAGVLAWGLAQQLDGINVVSASQGLLIVGFAVTFPASLLMTSSLLSQALPTIHHEWGQLLTYCAATAYRILGIMMCVILGASVVLLIASGGFDPS